jgi:hypothetical protein
LKFLSTKTKRFHEEATKNEPNPILDGHQADRAVEIFYNCIRVNSNRANCEYGGFRLDCPHCGERDNTEHVLYKCPAYAEERRFFQRQHASCNEEKRTRNEANPCRKEPIADWGNVDIIQLEPALVLAFLADIIQKTAFLGKFITAAAISGAGSSNAEEELPRDCSYQAIWTCYQSSQPQYAGPRLVPCQ